ncbi:FAD/NAD(P)-binding domain-containing protein [Zopfia rhizophila CBS 207.26]|uniref:FAD/NAD(P)-binding domain-containing protein n=1 Tax=Zopfia rhizophila CBS 207.26 TaxID=1314779 RepID=A0A6A6DCB6_9PEZI|nr:FAD/NAD(P)-binding domain-containing protein [Zopfia rhizophila CBS 207.26]
MAKFPRLPPSGIKVIVVGAGFAGISAAIECDRKGHSVILLEKADNMEEITRIGDIISFDPNGSRAFERWPGVIEAMQRVARQTAWLDLYYWKGKFVTRQSFAGERAWGHRINGHRGELHNIIYNHAKDRGIDIRLGQRVTDYFETDESAGVVVNEKTRIVADVVVAAEGVRSRGRKIVLGFEDNPKSSGYAVYRAWFPGDIIASNDMLKHLVVNGDTHQGWIGPDLHFLASSLKGGKEFNWVFTHVDDGNIEESWQFPGKVDEALKYIEGWAPIVTEIVKATPKTGRLIDHKLVYRDPLPTFISPKARIALIGDAAHPFLPTSIQGASQSIEDGVALAVCLELAGKTNVPLAVRAYEKIRYGRVHKAQAMGVKTREKWHKANWDSIWDDPESIHLTREPWLLNFDAEADAYKKYNNAIADLTALRARL